MTSKELEAIRKRAETASKYVDAHLIWLTAGEDVPKLIAEVERLKEENSALKRGSETLSKEIERLHNAMNGNAVIANQSGARIHELEKEIKRLRGGNTGVIIDQRGGEGE